VVLVVPALAVAAPAKKPAPPGAKPTKLASKPSALVAKARVARQRAIDTSTLTPSAVARKIESTYLAGVESCLQSRLDAGVRAGGTVDVAFVVTPDGKTSEPSVKSFDDALTACVKSKAAAWTFAAPRRDDAPASTRFELQLALEARDAKKQRAAELAREQAEAQQVADLLTGTIAADDDKTLGDAIRRPAADLGARAPGSGGGKLVTAPTGTANTRAAKPPKPRVAFSAKQAFDDTTLSADAVAAKVMSTYVADIKRCYQARLGASREEAGKLALAFTVTAEGRTASLSGHSNQLADSVVKCVTAAAASWRFAVPRFDGDATSAAFEIELDLTAN
jgi:hypothetical protein